MSDTTKDIEALKQENKKLHEQLDEAIGRLVSAQKNIQKERDKAKKETALEYEGEIKEYKFKADKAEADKENALNEVKKCKKQIKNIKDKMDEKIQTAVLEKTTAIYDYIPKILKICDKLDEVSGGEFAKLQAIYEASGGKFDDMAKQRLSSIYSIMKDKLNIMASFLGIPSEEELDKADDFAGVPMSKEHENDGNYTRLNLT